VRPVRDADVGRPPLALAYEPDELAAGAAVTRAEAPPAFVARNRLPADADSDVRPPVAPVVVVPPPMLERPPPAAPLPAGAGGAGAAAGDRVVVREADVASAALMRASRGAFVGDAPTPEPLAPVPAEGEAPPAAMLGGDGADTSCCGGGC